MIFFRLFYIPFNFPNVPFNTHIYITRVNKQILHLFENYTQHNPV